MADKTRFDVVSIQSAGASARGWHTALHFGRDGVPSVVRLKDNKGREIEAHMTGAALLNIYFVESVRK